MLSGVTHADRRRAQRHPWRGRLCVLPVSLSEHRRPAGYPAAAPTARTGA